MFLFTFLSFAEKESLLKTKAIDSNINTSKPVYIFEIKGERDVQQLSDEVYLITCTSPPPVFCVDIMLYPDGHYEVDWGLEKKCSNEEPEVIEDEDTGITTVKFTEVDCE